MEHRHKWRIRSTREFKFNWQQETSVWTEQMETHWQIRIPSQSSNNEWIRY